MKCTSCKYPDTQVVETRHDDQEMIRRRRQCMRCGVRFTTQESLKEPRKPLAGSLHVVRKGKA
jgi:transcriptional repressor NrdR